MNGLLRRRGGMVLGLALCASAAVSCKKDAGGAPGAGAGTQKQPVEVVAVERRDMIETLTLVGSLAPNESAELRPEISGLVREISFEEGRRVEAGAVLLTIADDELRAQLAQSEARFQLAELNLKRSENLSESRTIPQSEVDRARSEFVSSQAERALLQLRLEKTQVKAPFAGVVGSRAVSPGDYITPSTVLTRIDDLSRLKIDFQVPERTLAKVSVGTPFTVRSKALDTGKGPGGEVKGEVYFVSSVIDRSTRSSEVKGFLLDPPERLKPGMFANVELVLDVQRGVLTVPEGAVLATPRGAQVIGVKATGEERLADFIPVRTGLRAKGYVAVEPAQAETLKEGQEIVAAGVGALILFPGAKLDPKPLKEQFRTGG